MAERADRRDILRVDKGEIRYYSEDEADERMNSFISKIEHQHETAKKPP